MGVGANGLQFALLAKRLGVDFDRTIMLGRQNHFLDGPSLRTVLTRFGIPLSEAEERTILQDAYSENLFRKLGARTVTSIDASNYEGADIIHDFNTPIDAALHRSYSCLIDFGTLEHIFNIPVALKNCTDLLEVGGQYLSIVPANNMLGHGFYQFSPELFFNYLSHNGFTDIDVFVMLYRYYPYLFHVANPSVLRDRVELVNAEPVVLAIVARKVAHLETARTPLQSDYRDTFWQGRIVNRRRGIEKGQSQIAAAVRQVRQQIASLMAWPETLSPHFVYGFDEPRYYQMVDPAACDLRSPRLNAASTYLKKTIVKAKRLSLRGSENAAQHVVQAGSGAKAAAPSGRSDPVQPDPADPILEPVEDRQAPVATAGPEPVGGFDCLDWQGVLIPLVPGVSSEVTTGHEAAQHAALLAALLDMLIQGGEEILVIGSECGFTSTYCARNPHVKAVACIDENPNLVEAIKLTHRINNVEVTVFNEIVGAAADETAFYERADVWAMRGRAPLGSTIEVEKKPLQERLDQIRPTMLIMSIAGDCGELFEQLDLAGLRKIVLVLQQSTMTRPGIKKLFDALSARGFHYDSWHSSHAIVTFSHVDRG